MKKYLYLFGILLLCVGLSLPACKTVDPLPPNPFDEFDSTQNGNGGNTVTDLPLSSFAGIHQKILKPTCANSGCHDGLFEPDFRTIESSYNSLILKPVIKNDPTYSYTFRVQPGNPDLSVLVNRLERDIDGQSDTMPLRIDPGSDWRAKRPEYIAAIRQWISSGAKDMFGNAPQSGNLPPAAIGLVMFPTGSSTPLARETANGTIIIPAGITSVDVWFAFSDDATAPSALSYNKIKVNSSPNNFAAIAEQNLSIQSPLQAIGYAGINVDFTHKITLNTASFNTSVQYLRVYVKDASNTLTEIPTDAAADYTKRYFSFKKE